MNVGALVPVGAVVPGGGPTAAALVRVAGVPLLVRAVRGLLTSGAVDRVVVVRTEDDAVAVDAVLHEHGLPGGVVVPEVSDPELTVLLVHDPLRAFTPADLVARVVAEVVATGAVVVPVLPCSDTVKRLDSAGVITDTPDRSLLRVRQTPVGLPASRADEAFDTGLLAGAHTVAGDPAAVALAGPVALAQVTVDRGGRR